MHIRLLLVVLYGFFSIVFYILVYVLYVRKRGMSARCTKRALGTVVGPSAINYAGHHIPLVQYEVAGKTYKKAGPKFESGSAFPNAQCNLVDGSNPPTRLVAPSLPLHSSQISVNRIYDMSPVSKVYPIGTRIDVWYDPLNPKNAYVLRPIREGMVALKVLLPLAIMFSVAAVITICFM